MNMYKGHMDEAKGGRIKGGKQRWVGWGERVGEKWRQLYLNNNLKNNKLKIKIELSLK